MEVKLRSKISHWPKILHRYDWISHLADSLNRSLQIRHSIAIFTLFVQDDKLGHLLSDGFKNSGNGLGLIHWHLDSFFWLATLGVKGLLGHTSFYCKNPKDISNQVNLPLFPPFELHVKNLVFHAFWHAGRQFAVVHYSVCSTVLLTLMFRQKWNHWPHANSASHAWLWLTIHKSISCRAYIFTPTYSDLSNKRGVPITCR